MLRFDTLLVYLLMSMMFFSHVFYCFINMSCFCITRLNKLIFCTWSVYFLLFWRKYVTHTIFCVDRRGFGSPLGASMFLVLTTSILVLQVPTGIEPALYFPQILRNQPWQEYPGDIHMMYSFPIAFFYQNEVRCNSMGFHIICFRCPQQLLHHYVVLLDDLPVHSM